MGIAVLERFSAEFRIAMKARSSGLQPDSRNHLYEILTPRTGFLISRASRHWAMVAAMNEADWLIQCPEKCYE